MIGYIYQIQNIITKENYIGQTIDIYRRQKAHFRELRNNTHVNPKLQASWNKYGEESFSFTYWTFNINSLEELDRLECEYIEEYNSLEDGFNLIPGGSKPPLRQKVQDDDIATFLCIHELLGDGYGKTCEKIFGWSKGTASAAKRKIRYANGWIIFENLSPAERKQRAEDFIQSQHLLEMAKERQMSQGGCERAYSLTKEDYYFAFCAQELGYKAATVAHHFKISDASVYDWFNGRHRKKEKNEYLSLSEEQKDVYRKKVKEAQLNNK